MIDSIVWLLLLITFLIVEAATVSLVSTWFAGGALAALLVSILNGPVWLQVVVFLVVSAALLCLLHPIVKKHLKPKLVATNSDSLVGKICEVVEPVDTMSGRVKVGDVIWSARTESTETIPAGEKVRILKIQGVKVFVEHVKTEVDV